MKKLFKTISLTCYFLALASIPLIFIGLFPVTLLLLVIAVLFSILSAISKSDMPPASNSSMGMFAAFGLVGLLLEKVLKRNK